MIFSEDKWNQAGEIQQYITVSNSLSFKTMAAPLKNSFDAFIVPVLGSALAARLTEIYKNVPQNEAECKFLHLAQKANANLALWHDFMELQFMISDGGFHRDESDRLHSLYKYQEHELKRGWHEKGFNALDDLIAFLDNSISDFPEWLESGTYKNRKTAIVRSTNEFNQYYNITRSALTFLRLVPHIQVVCDTVIAPRLGEIYTNLITKLAKPTPEQKFENLRVKLLPVVVFYSAARLMRETGSLTDRGLLFSTTKGNDAATQTDIITDERLMMQIQQAETDGDNFWRMAEGYMKVMFDYEKPSAVRFPKRDNNGKKSFWA